MSDTPKYTALKILGMVAVGLGLSGGLFFITQLFEPFATSGTCNGYGAVAWLFCRMHILMVKHSPWILFTGLTSAPPLLLIWFWRETHKREDIENERRRLNVETFTKAVEQLGNTDSVHIRIGGIYALEQLMRTDPENYHNVVVKTLAAFVRESAKFSHDNYDEKYSKYSSFSSIRENGILDNLKNIPLYSDIRTSLEILGKRKNRILETDEMLDLSEIDLSGYNLCGLDLSYSNFYKSKFTRSYLNEKSNMERSKFIGCLFYEANFYGPNLSMCDFLGALIISSGFPDSNLSQSSFINTRINHCDFRRVNFTQSILLLDDSNGFPENMLYDAFFYNGPKKEFRTQFRAGFNPLDHGMIPVDENGDAIENYQAQSQEPEPNPNKEQPT